MILVCGGEKGGTGKTTLALNLAALRTQKKHDVLLVDADPQKTATEIVAIRNEDGVEPRIKIIEKTGKDLHTAIAELADRYEDIIIDTGGRDSMELKRALGIADKILIPIQPSQLDFLTLEKMDFLVSQMNPDLVGTVVISRSNPNTNEDRDVAEAIEGFENLKLAETIVYDRVVHRKLAREGRVAFEGTGKSRDAKAILEIETLYAEIFGK